MSHNIVRVGSDHKIEGMSR